MKEKNAPNLFMTRALELALENVRTLQGGPFAALVVKDGQILAEGVNRVTSLHDPTAHAEILAIREACRKLGHFELKDCEIYATCEPCPMCLGAIYWARVAKIYFAGTVADASKAGFDDSLIYRGLRRPARERKIPMIGMMRKEAREIFEAWEKEQDKIRY